MPRTKKDLDLQDLFNRAARHYQEDCDELFEQAVDRLVSKTQMDEEEVRDWLGSLV